MYEKLDCFSYERKNKQFKCIALNVKNCLKCKFYKTKEQYDYKLSNAPKTVVINGKVCVKNDTR